MGQCELKIHLLFTKKSQSYKVWRILHEYDFG